MTNGFFTAGTYATAYQLARAAAIQTFAALVEAAFDLLPTEAQLKRGTVTAIATAESGSATAYVVTSNYAATSLVDMMEVIFRPANSNTGADPTLTVDSLTAKAIKRPNGESIAAGEIVAGAITVVRYDAGDDAYHLLTQANVNLGDLTTITTNVSTNETNITSLDARVTVNEGDIDTAETNITNIDGRVTVIETAVLEARVSFYYPGLPVLDDLLFFQVFDAGVLFPAGLSSSEAYLLTAPSTEALVVEIRKNNVAVGSFTIAVAANTATFTFSSNVTFSDGDRMSFHVTSDTDDTADSLSAVVVGTPQ